MFFQTNKKLNRFQNNLRIKFCVTCPRENWKHEVSSCNVKQVRKVLQIVEQYVEEAKTKGTLSLQRKIRNTWNWED